MSSYPKNVCGNLYFDDLSDATISYLVNEIYEQGLQMTLCLFTSERLKAMLQFGRFVAFKHKLLTTRNVIDTDTATD